MACVIRVVWVICLMKMLYLPKKNESGFKPSNVLTKSLLLHLQFEDGIVPSNQISYHCCSQKKSHLLPENWKFIIESCIRMSHVGKNNC